jgi:hypothetical protein
MKRYKIYILTIAIVISLFLFTPGCQKSVQLTLKAKPGQIESYRLKTVSQRIVAIEGPQPENRPPLEGGQTTDKIEMVFDQQIQNIEPSGNALEKITIRELKYFGEVRNEPVLDFNSTKDKDPDNALFALVGQSYIIDVTPSGKVSKVIDVNNARAEIKKSSSNYEAAKNLLEDKTIEKRHSLPLPDEKHNELKTGDKWSNVVTIEFGRMGNRTFERIYKLDKIEKTGSNVTASVSMSAIPSVVDANNTLRGTEATPPMTDIKFAYSGTMKFDVTTGTLIRYQENLMNEWVIVPPGTGQSEQPIVFRMTANQSYDMEKLK